MCPSDVRVPDTNPLAPAGALPPGHRVALLLGAGSASAAGRRVVTGTVVGTAIRSDPSAVDVQLGRMTTWIYGDPPLDLEVLPPHMTSVFRVEITRTAEATVHLVAQSGTTGRSPVSAFEVPWRACFTCRTPLGQGQTFCGGCGRRASVGCGAGRSTTPPPDLATACPACWSLAPGRGRNCVDCGFSLLLATRTAALIGTPARTVHLRAGMQRLAQLRGRVTDLRVERRSASGWPQLVATLADIEIVGTLPRALGAAPTPEMHCAMVVHVGTSQAPDTNRLSETVEALTGGDAPVFGTELTRPCPACVTRATRGLQPPAVLSRHCPDCGTRVRLAPHPKWPHRMRGAGRTADRLRHRCGASYREGVDRWCPGCGNSLAGFRPSLGRFSRLG